jgi:uncharacterized cupredoxin-like copper-binding protein
MAIRSFGSIPSRLIGALVGASLIALLILTLSACGGGAATPKTPVEVQVTATEFKFDSSLTTFSVGTPYHFVLTNKGSVGHDWMILAAGEKDETKSVVEVEDTDFPPGKTLTKDYTFTQPGNYEFACHVAGHYEAGMVLKIVVK